MPICSFYCIEHAFNGKLPSMRDYFLSVIIHKRNTRYKVIILLKEQRRILKLEKASIYTRLL